MMKSRIFDAIIIVVLAGSLILLHEFDLLEQNAKFGMIPLMAVYFLGKYAGKRSADKN